MGLRLCAVVLVLVLFWGCVFSGVAAPLRAIPPALKEEVNSSTVDPGLEISNFSNAFGKSFLMILVAEFGDDTFIIAAIMAMRHSRLAVFCGALLAESFMTIVSTGLGYMLPNLISRTAVHYAATVAYTLFGLRLLWVAWHMPADDISNQEEVEEAQQKLAKAEQEADHGRVRRLVSRICTPVLVQALLLTFVAEWGDRSQIANVTLAAENDPFGVTLGALTGHVLCTGSALIGKLLAMSVPQRLVACTGAALFLVFALRNLTLSPES
eukprot:jgi/Botrbrau1/19606/Bobra.0035s0083.2